MSLLSGQLRAALDSRAARGILRRLPDPAEAALVDFTSNDYLSLAASPRLRALFLARLAAAPHVLGARGSRLLVNPPAHAALEARLAAHFRAPAALLFNSGFDANAAFFACVPQPGDVVVLDAHVHASVHDGVRASRAAAATFPHNSPAGLRAVLAALAGAGHGGSVFVAVESVYSMDGSRAPLRALLAEAHAAFPGAAHVVVDEAHATGVFGARGRGRVAELGLEDRVFARLHTFGKALAGAGAVVLTTPLVRDYLLNYARALIYTTAPPHATVAAVDAALDLLADGTADALAARTRALTATLVARLRALPPGPVTVPAASEADADADAPPGDPAPIVPLLTRRPHALAAHLRAAGLNARPIAWPTVERGAERVRVCVHAGNSAADVGRLVAAVAEWARAEVEAGAEAVGAKL